MDAVEGERGAPEIAWAAREFAPTELADVQPLGDTPPDHP